MIFDRDLRVRVHVDGNELGHVHRQEVGTHAGASLAKGPLHARYAVVRTNVDEQGSAGRARDA